MSSRGRTRAGRGKFSLSERLTGNRARFVIAGAMLAIALLIGGGSRADIVSLTALRPLAVLALGYWLIAVGPRAIVRFGAPAWLLLALTVLMALQLVPLPSGWWSSMPGREMLASHDRFLFHGTVARPLTLSPSGTWNALFALTVPWAVMAGCAGLERRARVQLLWVVMAMVALNVLVAALQILGPGNGALYFFRITNYNNPVGLFSNRNHLAMFLASVLPMIVFGALAGQRDARRGPLVTASAAAGGVGVLLIVMASGSRAGTLLLAVSLLGTGALWLIFAQRAGRMRRGKARRQPLLMFAIAASLAIAVGLAAIATSRSSSVDRLLEESLEADLRVQVTPQLWDMITAYFPFGSGFGSFAKVYAIAEPFALLRPTYLNHAHNDFLEFPIEGGLAATLLMIGMAVWFLNTGWQSTKRVLVPAHRDAMPPLAPFAWLGLAVLVAGSLGDYPLRTPAIMAWAVLLVCLLQDGAQDAVVGVDGGEDRP